MIELLKELSIKSFENAEELYVEANILFENEKYSRAFFLTQIAGEELGKHVICSGAVVNFIVGKFDFSRFKKRFYNHMEKTQSIDSFEEFFLDNIEKCKLEIIEENAKSLEKAKLMGLYCGFIGKYAFKPSEIISKSFVESVIVLLKNRIGLIRSSGLVYLLKTSEKIPIERIKDIYNKYVDLVIDI